MRIVTVKTAERMQHYQQQVWAIMTAAYADVPGGWHYASLAELCAESACWRLVIHGGRVIAAALYKAKKGLKLVAMGVCQQMRDLGKRGLARVLRADLSRCWMELSEAAERFVLTHCNGHRYIIHASLASSLLDKEVAQESDGYHYARAICGLQKSKIIVGTPQH